MLGGEYHLQLDTDLLFAKQDSLYQQRSAGGVLQAKSSQKTPYLAMRSDGLQGPPLTCVTARMSKPPHLPAQRDFGRQTNSTLPVWLRHAKHVKF